MRNEPKIQEFLETLDQSLQTRLTPLEQKEGAGSLWEAAQHVTLASSAKRSRPILVYRFGEALGVTDEAKLAVAVAAELIHAASLVHDDVIDEGTQRRGRSTVNTKWNNVTAVLTGDLMFSLAFSALHALPRAVMDSAVDVLSEMTRSAIQEVEARGQLSLSLKAWRQIASGKTGALFGWCGSAAARVIDNEKSALAFEHCGRELGVAFQLGDDLKDLVGNDGKDAFADLKNKNPNYPILWACKKDPHFEQAIKKLWSLDAITQSDAESLGQSLVELGAPAACLQELKKCIESALKALGPLRANDEIQEVEAWAMSLLKTTFADPNYTSSKGDRVKPSKKIQASL